MKITIKNTGCIKDADLELNDLTIIAGENNTGKTYLTYVLYDFLKRWIEYVQIDESKEISEALLNDGILKIDASNFNKDRLENIFSGITERFSKQINDIFSADIKLFLNSKISVDLDYKKNKNSKIELKASYGQKSYLNAKKDDNNILLKLTIDETDTQSLWKHNLNIKKILATLLFTNLLPMPFVLTSERLGISLFYKELDISKNVIVDYLQKMPRDKNKPLNPFKFLDDASSRYANPIRDNINFIRDLDIIQKKAGLLSKNIGLHDKIKRMLGGYFKKQNDVIRFVSTAKKNGKFNIPLHLSSTSARALCDFYFYLKHVAQEGQLLMIDEPESHLSPANQVLMARLLALCVNNGLKVYITTHSDYIIKEFNNLIMLNNEFKGKDKFIASRKNKYTKDDFLKPENVNAYVCENGSLTKCSVDNKGIEIKVFEDAIEEINYCSDELDFLTDFPEKS